MECCRGQLVFEKRLTCDEMIKVKQWWNDQGQAVMKWSRSSREDTDEPKEDSWSLILVLIIMFNDNYTMIGLLFHTHPGTKKWANHLCNYHTKPLWFLIVTALTRGGCCWVFCLSYWFLLSLNVIINFSNWVPIRQLTLNKVQLSLCESLLGGGWITPAVSRETPATPLLSFVRFSEPLLHKVL